MMSKRVWLMLSVIAGVGCSKGTESPAPAEVVVEAPKGPEHGRPHAETPNVAAEPDSPPVEGRMTFGPFSLEVPKSVDIASY